MNVQVVISESRDLVCITIVDTKPLTDMELGIILSNIASDLKSEVVNVRPDNGNASTSKPTDP